MSCEEIHEVQRIVDWFFEHYEPPTERLKSVRPLIRPEDDDYLFFGGPVRASVVVHAEFDGKEQEHHIERALEIIKSGWKDLFQMKKTPQTIGAAVSEHILQFFAYEHLPQELQYISKQFTDLAMFITTLPRNPERTVALRKLLEAKDAAVRARLAK